MTLSSSPLNRQKLVIIGGNSGIGAAVAYAAVGRGASVVLASRRTGCMQHYQPAAGGNLRVMQADVTDQASLRALFAEVGEFDHPAFTAGPVVQAKLLADTDFDEAQASFDVKLWAHCAPFRLRCLPCHRRAPSP